MRQRLSRRMAEATQLGMALKGPFAADLACQQRSQLSYHDALPRRRNLGHCMQTIQAGRGDGS